MRRVLQADFKRLASKILPWVLLICCYLYIWATWEVEMDDAPDLAFTFVKVVESRAHIVSLLVGFTLLLGVYRDEFKSMALIGVIGRGIDRVKFVLAKFLDIVILGGFMFILTGLFIFALTRIYELTFTPAEIRFLWLFFVFDFVELMSYLSLAAIFFFLTENAPLGIFAYLAFDSIVPIILYFMETMPQFAKYHLQNFYVDGIVSQSFSNFIMRDYLLGFLLILISIVVYIGGSLFITILIFRKKELEF